MVWTYIIYVLLSFYCDWTEITSRITKTTVFLLFIDIQFIIFIYQIKLIENILLFSFQKEEFDIKNFLLYFNTFFSDDFEQFS
jgi:hypothetical protein